MQIVFSFILNEINSNYQLYVVQANYPSEKESRKTFQKELNTKLLKQVTKNPSLQLHYQETGKPYIDGNNAISFSHSGNYTALMITQSKSAGVDIEMTDRNIEAGIDYFLNTNEIAFLSLKEKNLQALTCWCIKEAAIKYFNVSGIDFKNCIHIQPFELLNLGMATVLIQHNQEEIIKICYRREKDFLLAYTVD
ncbi:MAG TPA: 4'-phosphopantetheinyl transferase superfamily protein [Bacteroidia bacterium]|nr:4'-phosphopantetheinyl transferase superfamily protein [Bacteroidia bacterium]HQZ78341.1 4'-phosphopantetheinyl transferase superfamily protein [Bacteroidia bacterium]